MSDIIGFATPRKTSRAELLAGWLAGGEIRIYDGTRPATADTAISTQTLLVTFAIPDPAGEVTAGVFEGDAIEPVLIAATGVAAWARVVDSLYVTIFDADVGLDGSGDLIEIDNLNLAEGGDCSLTSFTFTES